MFTLRQYQQTALDAIRAAFQDGIKAVLYQAPTASGKTVLFTFIAHHGSRLGTRVCILVHRRELLKQASATLTDLGVHHGIIAPWAPRTDSMVQVASKDTLGRRAGHEFDLIVIDEAHHATAPTYRRIWEANPNAVRLGVTATPCRLSGAGLATVFDHLICGPSVAGLTPEYLSPYEYYGPPVKVNLTGLRSLGGDYSKDELTKAMDMRHITGDCIAHYRKYLNGRPAIAFCASVAHAEHVAEQFRAEGFRAVSVDGTLNDEVRDERISGLADGRVNVLASCDLVSEGLDVPVCMGALLLRPTKSLNVYLQQVGRVLRRAPGKEKAIILDHVGNYLRHGLPDTPREWSLEQGAVKKKDDDGPVEQARQCPACWYIHDPAPVCPSCGHVYKLVRKPPPKVKYGELERVEISREDAAELIRRARTLKDFHRVGAKLGYKPGWAWRQAKMRRA